MKDDGRLELFFEPADLRPRARKLHGQDRRFERDAKARKLRLLLPKRAGQHLRGVGPDPGIAPKTGDKNTQGMGQRTPPSVRLKQPHSRHLWRQKSRRSRSAMRSFALRIARVSCPSLMITLRLKMRPLAPAQKTKLLFHLWLYAMQRSRFLLPLCAALLTAGCATLGAPGLEEGAKPRIISIFAVSTRKAEGDASSDALDGGGPRYSLQMLSVPPVHKPGNIERPSFGAENPREHFAALSRRGLDEDAFYTAIASHVSGRTGANRDILLYVHGFNTSYDEARFRLAQIVSDARFGGLPVLYTWPATGSLLDYVAAKENATIARDPLSRLLRRLSEVPSAGRIHILAHSMGAWLAMEALREDALAGSPNLNGKLGEVMLAAPDIDLSVFREQISRLDPSHICILAASNDRALSLSRRLAGDRPRLGALDLGNPEDRAAIGELGVKAYDVSRESTGWTGHATYASAPLVVRMIGAQLAEARPQEANVQAVLGERPVQTEILAAPLAPPAAPPGAGAAAPPQAAGPPSAPAQ